MAKIAITPDEMSEAEEYLLKRNYSSLGIDCRYLKISDYEENYTSFLNKKSISIINKLIQDHEKEQSLKKSLDPVKASTSHSTLLSKKKISEPVQTPKLTNLQL